MNVYLKYTWTKLWADVVSKEWFLKWIRFRASDFGVQKKSQQQKQRFLPFATTAYVGNLVNVKAALPWTKRNFHTYTI